MPGGVQGLDRYAYVNNNPLKYTDPTGHTYCDFEKCQKIDPPTSSSDNDNDDSNGSKPPFDSSLGENAKDPSETSQPFNPSPSGIFVVGVVLTVTVAVTEVLFSWAEVALTPVVAAAPIVGVPMEAVLVSCSLDLGDIELIYLSNAARVNQNPNEK